MILKWFDASEAQAFGRQLAQTFLSRLTPIDKLNDKKFEVKARETLERMAKEVALFRSTHPLNFYKKAKMGNAFKWALRDAGYDSDYTDELTEWLMLTLR